MGVHLSVGHLVKLRVVMPWVQASIHEDFGRVGSERFEVNWPLNFS
jgi:hypothetical protein